MSGCQSVNILYTEYNKINIKKLDIIFDRDYFKGIKTSLDKMFKNTNDEKTEFKTLKKKLKKLQDKCKETDVDYEIKFEMQYVNNFFSEFGDDLSDTEKALIFEEYSKHITETINGQENKQAYMNKLGFGNLKIGSNYLTPEEYLQLLSQASDSYKYEAVAKVMSKPESERTAAENQAMDKWFSAVENIDNDELNALQLLTKSMLAQGKALSFVDDEGNLTNEYKYSYYAEMSQSAQEGFVVKFQLGADSVDSYRIVPFEDGGCELFVTIDGIEQLITDENKPEAIINLNEIKDFLVFRVQAKYNNQANFYAKQVQELQEERTKVENKLADEKRDNFSGNYAEIITPEMKKMETQIEEIDKKISLYSKYCESFQNKSFEANKMYSDYKKLSSQCPIESYTIKYVPSSTPNGLGRTEVTFYSDKDKTQPVEPSEEQIAFFLSKENLSVNDLMISGVPLHGYNLEDIKAFQKAGTDNLNILNYVQNKYGVDASEYYVDYVKDLGKRVIGKEMAQHRIDVLDDIDSDFVDGLYVTLCGTGDGLTQFAEGIGNLFGADGEVSSREYMVMDFSEYLASNYSTGAIMVGAYEISTSIGNMLPSIALSFVPGVGQALSIASIGLSCAGNAREEGLQMGMTEGQAWAYGIVSGSLEACLQFFLGGIKPLQKGGSQLMENELKNILIDMGKEAREEMLQEVLNPIYLNIIMNWDGDDSFLTNVLNSFTSAYEGSQNIEMEQVIKAGIYAVITAGVMNSPSNVRNITSKLTTGNSVTYAYLIQKYRGQDLSYSDVMSNLKNDIDVIANNDVKINQLVESLKANPDFEAQFNSYNEQIINPDNRISFDEYALTTAIETILTVNKPLINSTETITNVNDAIVQSTIDTLNSQKDLLTDLKSKVEEKIKANEEIMNNTELDNATRINAESENIGLREKVKEIDKSIEAISNELNQPTIKSTNITEVQVASRLADLLFTVPENQETVSKNAFTKVKEFFINKFGNIEEQTVSEGVDYTVYNVSELNSQKTEIQNKISELESKGTELTEEEKITLEKYKSSLERINKVIELKNKLPKTNEEKTLDELIESRNEIQEEILAYDAVIEGLNTGNYSAYTEEIEAYKKAYAPRIESLRTELQTIDNLIETNYSEEIDSSKISNKTAYDINSLKEKLIVRKTELEKTVEELEASLKSNNNEQLVENIDSELSSIKEKINTIDEMLADFTLFENTMAKVTSEIKSNEVQEIVEAKDVESLKQTVEQFNNTNNSHLTEEQYELANQIKEINALDELNIERNKINEMFDNLSYEGQKEIIDSILSRMMSGENLSRETYSLIFNSSLFDGNSPFSKKYLHDFIKNGFGNVKGSEELANIVSQTYENARQSTKKVEMQQLYSYCDHTESHVLQVAFLTVNSLTKVNSVSKRSAAITEEQFAEMFYSGLFHDLGMAAGSFDTNGNPTNLGINMIANYLKSEIPMGELSPEIINSKEYKKLAKFVRENHTINSAMAILSNREYIQSIGLNPDRLALLCFSHSKSNSGVGKLDKVSDWSYSIQKINSAVTEMNKALSKMGKAEIRFDTSSFGEFTNEQILTFSGQKFANEEDKKKINVKKFNFNPGVIDLLAVEGLSLRIGDAYVSKASIKLDTPVRWVYNGIEYSANTLVLTQTGAYMAYDAKVTQLYDSVNNCDTEVSDVGGFAFFEISETGDIVPWGSTDENSSASNETNESGAYINPNLMFSEPLTGKIKISSDKSIEAYLTENGYYYTENEVTNEKQYYKYNEETRLYELVKEQIDDSVAGKLLYTSTGKFLVGENNVSYWLEVFEGKLKSNYYIADMSIFPFNTISKGVEERLGEIETASEQLEKIVDIVIKEMQFSQNFKKINEDLYVATTELGDIYINELRRSSKNGDVSFMTVNGIEFSKFRTQSEVQEIVEARDVESLKQTVEQFNNTNNSHLTEEQYELANQIKEINALDELNIERNKINEMFDNLSYEGQKEIIDSILSRMMSGENLSRETYSLIFNSSLFDGNSPFSKKYLHDFIKNGFGNVKGSEELANIVSQTYENARQSTKKVEMQQLYSYCDHTESHVLQVAFLTVNSLTKVNSVSKRSAAITEEQFAEMFYSGLFHDLGMAAGSFDTNGNPTNLGINMIANYLKSEIPMGELSPEIINSKEYKKLAKFVRENHTINSAMAILSNREYIQSIGLNPDRLALLCFSHSKSNSGVGKLDKVSDWSYSIQKINSAVTEMNKALSKMGKAEIRFDTSSFGEFTNEQILTFSGQKFANEEDKKKINVKKFNFNPGVIDLLAVEGLSLRIGDAYVSKASIKLDTPVRWVYNGIEYSANTLVLTQTGAYMAYDAKVTQLYDSVNNCDTEVSDVGGFAFFEISETGDIVPWGSTDENSSASNETNESGAYINPNLMFSEPLTGKIKISSDKSIEAYLTENGYYYTENEVTNEKQYYKYNEETRLYELVKEQIDDSVAGKLLYTSTGKFLVGENNVSYWLEVFEGKLKSNYYIADMSIFPFNTISKGVEERLGEIETASEQLEKIVDIVIKEMQFSQNFKKINEDLYVATTELGDIYINELRRSSKNGDVSFMTVNGIEFSKFATQSEVQKVNNINDLTLEQLEKINKKILSKELKDVRFIISEDNNTILTWDKVYEILKNKNKIIEDSKTTSENTNNEDVELDQISSAIDRANYRAEYHDNFVGVLINSLDELTYSHLERVSNRELVEFQIAESNEMITWKEAFIQLKREGKIPNDSKLMSEYKNEINGKIWYANHRATNHDNFSRVPIDSLDDLTVEQLEIVDAKNRDLVSFETADGSAFTWKEAFIQLKREGKIPNDSKLMSEYKNEINGKIWYANHRATNHDNFSRVPIDSLDDLTVEQLEIVDAKNRDLVSFETADGSAFTWKEAFIQLKREGKI